MLNLHAALLKGFFAEEGLSVQEVMTDTRVAQEYCCFFGIKRAIVDNRPDKAALIVRAFRRAKQWTDGNPFKAVITAKAAGYYSAAIPTEPSANLVASFGYDRQVDLEQMLAQVFKDRIESGAIQTDKTPGELVHLHYRKIEYSPASRFKGPQCGKVMRK